MTITLETVGRRLYFRGAPFSANERLREFCGPGHFDRDRKAYWCASSKREDAEKLIASLASAPEPAEDPDDIKVVGKARYKAKTYYVRWVGQCRDGAYKARLCSLDGKLDFWAACARPGESCDGSGDAAAIVKTYQPREVWDGRRYSGRTVTQHMTLGRIRRFLDEQREARASGEPTCAECGRPGELVADLEDGCLKHYRCCDIPPRG
jgi:hypothetical protein